MQIVKDLLASAVKPFTEYMSKRVDRQIAQDSLDAKIALSKNTDIKDITLSDAEWERIKANNEDKTWKDEYALILGTFPFWLVVIGCFTVAFFGTDSFLQATLSSITTLQSIGVDIGMIVETAIYAGLGVSIWRKMR